MTDIASMKALGERVVAACDKLDQMFDPEFTKLWREAATALDTAAAEIERMRGGVEHVHSDDLAVDRFAVAMKAKLAKKRAQGRRGWDDKSECTNAFLVKLLCEHVAKGDPVDVGNLAMMIHQRGERIC